MNKLRTIAISVFTAAIATLVLFSIAEAKNSKNNFVPMYEDQIIACNINAVCKIINIDDYFTDEGTEKLQMELNADIDTFNMSDLN